MVAISTLGSLAVLLVAPVMQSPNTHSGETSVSTATDNTQRGQRVVYTSRRYGFAVILPETWKGYTVLSGTWKAIDIQTGNVKESGPSITIRHPLWTEAIPRQDIPILVLTTAQWNEREQLSFGAALLDLARWRTTDNSYLHY
ncbi:MAG: hypothetical protein ACJ74Z_01095 [Bryobacteraceae bacterium]